MSATLLKPAGYISIASEEGVKEFDTYQCCHCGNHTPVFAGAGEQRGFCPMCNGVTCSNPTCHKHYPFEKKLDDYEKGKLLELK